MSGDEITLRPVGNVRGGRTEAVDDDSGPVTARIELDTGVVEPTATTGLADFSHVEVLFVFDRVDEATVCTGARHPRGRVDWPLVGILAQRAKDRPNRLGSTVCPVVAVGEGWTEVSGLDAIDGTPVVDVKPHMVGFLARGEVQEPTWATELMAGYW